MLEIVSQRVWGFTVGTEIVSPDDGVELLINVETSEIIAAQWETVDARKQPDGTRHRWRHSVPGRHILRTMTDLGPIDEEEESGGAQ